MAMNEEEVKKSDLLEEGGRYFHYDFHTSFDSTSPDEVVRNLNKSIAETGAYLKKVNFLILTFGTSIVYKLKASNRIVSNCHKVPNQFFEKEFLTSEFMEATMLKLIGSIKQMNPTLNLILTVSPVRHTKEGLVENSLSKSRLVDLCHRLISDANDVSYFPSYEIMMDELRDYRYYKSDLIHPTDLAVDIIWTYYQNTYFDTKSIKKVLDIGNLNLARNHIPFNPLSADHQNFKHNQLEKIESLEAVYPEIDFSEFRDFFSAD